LAIDGFVGVTEIAVRIAFDLLPSVGLAPPLPPQLEITNEKRSTNI
jgi:hypothetical protein